MNKTLTFLAACGFALLAGCSLAPQTIELNEQAELEQSARTERGALIAVVDERETPANVLGTRGGRTPEKSPLYLNKELADVLQVRLQSSLAQLGFGSNPATEQEPIKMELLIKEFYYECNNNLVSNECSMVMRFAVTVIDGNKTFKKPYGINNKRSVAVSPVVEYNQKWLNEMLDEVWVYMFNDPELVKALGLAN